MCDLDRTFGIFEQIRQALPPNIPLTAKMRLGWNHQAKLDGQAGKLAIGLCDRGAAAITVHGRTTNQKFKGTCDLDGIKRVVEDVAQIHPHIPIIGNGDIKQPADVINMLQHTGCAGVMIGRGSFSNPWLFRSSWALQQRVIERSIDPSDRAAVEAIDLSDIAPTEDDKLDMLLRFFHLMSEYRDESHARHVFRQKANLLGKTINGGHCRPLKNALREAKNASDVHSAIQKWRLEGPYEPDTNPIG